MSNTPTNERKHTCTCRGPKPLFLVDRLWLSRKEPVKPPIEPRICNEAFRGLKPLILVDRLAASRASDLARPDLPPSYPGQGRWHLNGRLGKWYLLHESTLAEGYTAEGKILEESGKEDMGAVASGVEGQTSATEETPRKPLRRQRLKVALWLGQKSSYGVNMA